MNRRITSCRVTANRDCLQMTSSTVMARRTTRPYLKIPCLIPGCWDQNLKKRKWWRFIPVRTSELYIYFSVLCCPAALNTQIHAEYNSLNSLRYLLKWFVEIVDYFTVLMNESLNHWLTWFIQKHYCNYIRWGNKAKSDITMFEM